MTQRQACCAGFEELNDATTQYFGAKRDARDRLYEQRVEGKIGEYEYLHELCSMSGGNWCREFHTVTPVGETSDSIVTWSPDNADTDQLVATKLCISRGRLAMCRRLRIKLRHFRM
jgi:hypothetical protein